MKPSVPYKIAYLTSTDPMDKMNWSGTHYFMIQALRKHCGEVILLKQTSRHLLWMLKVLNKLLGFITNRQFNASHNKLLSFVYQRHFSEILNKIDCDLIIAAIAATEIASLKIKLPIVYISDATFQTLKNYYPNFKGHFYFSSAAIDVIEKKAMNNAAVIVYPSEWAAASCINYYNISPSKVKVVPYGANLELIPTRDEVLPKVYSGKCKLIFVGVDWTRKGGEIAFDTLMELRRLKIDASLTVCGCVPPDKFRNEFISIFPYLNKANVKEEDKLKELLAEATFMLFPTRAECFGIVCCEANAFGVPVIASNTGGINSVIENGINGYTLNYAAQGKDYALKILDILSSEGSYQALSANARKLYEERLNWDHWGKALDGIIRELV